MAAPAPTSGAFPEYASIKNAPHIEGRMAAMEGDFFATEKVHGSNVSFHLGPDGVVRMARRRDFLTPAEKFHGWQRILAEYTDRVRELYASVVGTQEDTTMVLYGELYGGIWRDPRTGILLNKGAPQTEVHYAQEIGFIAFDLRTMGPGGDVYLPMEAFYRVCINAGVPTTRILCQGSFAEVMAWCTAHILDSTRIPECFTDTTFRATTDGVQFTLVPGSRQDMVPLLRSKLVCRAGESTYVLTVREVTSATTFTVEEEGLVVGEVEVTASKVGYMEGEAFVDGYMQRGQGPNEFVEGYVEGYVVKSVNENKIRDRYSPPEGDRAILKIKSEKFSEAHAAPKPKANTRTTTPTADSEIEPYLLDTRIDNVLSNMSEADRLNARAVAQAVITDAWKDYIQDATLHGRLVPRNRNVGAELRESLVRRVEARVEARNAR